MVRVEAEATRTLDLLELPFLESAALANLSYSPQPYSAGGYAVIPAIGSGHMRQDTCMSGAVLRLTLLQCTASWAQTTGQLQSTIGGDIAVGGVMYQLQDPMLVIRSALFLLGIRALCWPRSRLSRHYHTKARNGTFELLLQARHKDVAAQFEQKLLPMSLYLGLKYACFSAFSTKHATAKAYKRPTQASRVLLHCVRRASPSKHPAASALPPHCNSVRKGGAGQGLDNT